MLVMLLSIIGSIHCNAAAISATNCSWRRDIGSVHRPLNVCTQPTEFTSEVYLCNDAKELIRYSYDSTTDCSGDADSATIMTSADYHCGEVCPYMTWKHCANYTGGAAFAGAIGPYGICFEGAYGVDSQIYSCSGTTLYYKWWSDQSWAPNKGTDCEPIEGKSDSVLGTSGCDTTFGIISCNGTQLPFITEATVAIITTPSPTLNESQANKPTVDESRTYEPSISEKQTSGCEDNHFMLLVLVLMCVAYFIY